MEIKFDVYFKKNLGTLCKDNEVDLDGKEAYINLDLSLVDRLEANYSVGVTKYTDEVTIKNIYNKEILIPFKSDVVKKGLNEFEVVAYMKNGDIKISQTYTYNIEEGIGEGKQSGSGESSDGHTHSNLNILNSITQTKVNEWNNKADVTHSHNEYASKNHTHNASEIEGFEYDDTEIRGLISSLSKRIELLESRPPSTEITDIKLLYNFNNLNRGYADGTISLQTSGEANAGKYYIKWADENGELSEYEEITVFEMFGVNAIQTYNFIKLNLIPIEASRIVAIKDNVIKASFNIPSNKRITDSKKLSFGLISDMHVDGSGGSSSEANDDFVRALKYFDSKHVDMNILTGDAVNNGLLVDLEAFKNLKESSTNVPLYVCRGNHDTYNVCNIDNFTTYIEENGLHFEKEIKGDKYLFIGLNAEDFTTPFKSESIEWLKSKLEEYKNQRVFLMQHVFVGETGNIAGLYPYSDGFDMTEGTRSREFVDLLSKYRNVIMFTGHSHLDFGLQRLGENANVALRTKTLCHRVHTPSTSKPRKNDINTEDIPDNTYTYREGSQGYLVDVYDNYIVLHGIDFEKGLLLPYAQYILDTTPILIEDDNNTSYEHKLLSEITSLSFGSLTPNGEDKDSSASYRTDFIELNEYDNKTFILPGGLTYLRICIYDENKVFLKLNEENDNNEIPSKANEVRNLENIEGAKYIRLKGQGDLGNIRFNGSI